PQNRNTTGVTPHVTQMMETNEHRIVYEGAGEGADIIMGASQANFIVVGPGADKECAVMVNDPAAQYLAEQLGAELTPEWREAITAKLGKQVIEQTLKDGRHLSSVIFISRAVLEAHPE